MLSGATIDFVGSCLKRQSDGDIEPGEYSSLARMVQWYFSDETVDVCVSLGGYCITGKVFATLLSVFYQKIKDYVGTKVHSSSNLSGEECKEEDGGGMSGETKSTGAMNNRIRKVTTLHGYFTRSTAGTKRKSAERQNGVVKRTKR